MRWRDHENWPEWKIVSPLLLREAASFHTHCPLHTLPGWAAADSPTPEGLLSLSGSCYRRFGYPRITSEQPVEAMK